MKSRKTEQEGKRAARRKRKCEPEHATRTKRVIYGWTVSNLQSIRIHLFYSSTNPYP